jgi:hypothetical protein
MGRKTYEFKTAQERAAHQKPAKKNARGRAGAITARPAAPNPTIPSAKQRTNRKRVFELGLTANERPPRKPSLPSRSHVKTDGPLRITAVVRMAAPSARAQRRNGNPN